MSLMTEDMMQEDATNPITTIFFTWPKMFRILDQIIVSRSRLWTNLAMCALIFSFTTTFPS